MKADQEGATTPQSAGEAGAAAQAIEEGKHVAAYLLEQLDPGTSMGGARPKNVVEDAQGLWLAKFPDRNDRWSNARVEPRTA